MSERQIVETMGDILRWILEKPDVRGVQVAASEAVAAPGVSERTGGLIVVLKSEDGLTHRTIVTGTEIPREERVPVVEAFNDVARAKKDSERAVEDARVYANEVVPQARGDAQTITKEALGAYEMRVNTARGEAERFNGLLAEYEKDPSITKTRLYLETIERLLAKTKVVIVDERSEVTIIED